MKGSLKIAFITTVELANASGGAVYSSSLLSSIKLLKNTVVDTVVLERYKKKLPRFLLYVLAYIESRYKKVPLLTAYHSGVLCNKLTEFSATLSNYDILIFDHLESTLIIHNRNINKQKVIYCSHNIESNIVKSRFRGAPEIFIHREYKSTLNYESKIASEAFAVTSISSEEIDFYKKLNSKVEHILPSFELTLNNTESYLDDRDFINLGFIGPRDWKPNKDAFSELITKVLPNVKRKTKLYVAGKGWHPERAKENVGNCEIIYLGFVKNIEVFWAKLDMLVCPVVSGAGVNVKVCEALSIGIPVVGYSKTFRGLGEYKNNPIILEVMNSKAMSLSIDSYTEKPKNGKYTLGVLDNKKCFENILFNNNGQFYK